MENTKAIHVLIVDDEECFRETTSKILKKRGFDVKAVASGIEAVEEIREKDIDVVILDIKMPGMDGNEALREIKKLNPQVEVIMLSGHGTPESAAEGLRDGVFDYLSKPCNIDLLANTIFEAVLTKKRLPQVERRVKDIMVPISTFSTIHQFGTAAEAVEIIMQQSFMKSMISSTVHESIHRSILVMDEKKRIIGLLSFTDFLKGMQPPYMRLLDERPLMADSIHLEPPNCSGMFTIMVRDLKKVKVRDLMSETPPTIDADSNLMEAAGRMLSLNVRRLLVEEDGEITGVVREQDLFFVIANILKRQNE